MLNVLSHVFRVNNKDTRTTSFYFSTPQKTSENLFKVNNKNTRTTYHSSSIPPENVRKPVHSQQ